jgi:hypothetical protein
MKALFNSWITRALALMLVASVAFAQDRVPFRDEELDQMLAPIALYPDPLLSQVLMASTYPLEVVQASRWSRGNPRMKGQEAVRAVESQDWDPSVKSLTAFPQVLTMLDQKLEWTERVGEAFLAQPEDVMDSVQKLRRQAEIAGNLRSNEQMRVAREGEYITISPPAPQVVYVPYYDPRVVYGTWWYPAYPPVYWAPAPAYYVVPAHRPAFLWGSGVAISAGFFFGHTDWHHRHVTVHKHVNHVTVNRTTVVNAPAATTRTVWRHDPAHRRGVPFRNADARQRFEQRTVATRTSTAPRASNPPAETRQRQMDERRKAAEQRRDDRKAERREPATPQAAAPGVNPSASQNADRANRASRPEARNAQPSGERRVERIEGGKGAERRESAPPRAAAKDDGKARPPANREAGQARPAPKPETKRAQPEPRPQSRSPQQTERREPAAPQRAAPGGNNKGQPANREAERPRPAARPDARNSQSAARPQARTPQPTAERRVERREAPRPQARSVEPRPAVARPAPRVEHRGTGQARAAQPSQPRASPTRAAPAPRAEGNQRRIDRQPRS